MTLKLQPNITQGIQELNMCEDYWAYDPATDYIDHVQSVCHKHSVSTPELFNEIRQCFAYLDDVRCAFCGYVCPVEIPADIPYMQSKDSWYCEVCEYDMQQAQYRQTINYKLEEARQLRLSGF